MRLTHLGGWTEKWRKSIMFWMGNNKKTDFAALTMRQSAEEAARECLAVSLETRHLWLGDAAAVAGFRDGNFELSLELDIAETRAFEIYRETVRRFKKGGEFPYVGDLLKLDPSDPYSSSEQTLLFYQNIDNIIAKYPGESMFVECKRLYAMRLLVD